MPTPKRGSPKRRRLRRAGTIARNHSGSQASTVSRSDISGSESHSGDDSSSTSDSRTRASSNSSSSASSSSADASNRAQVSFERVVQPLPVDKEDLQGKRKARALSPGRSRDIMSLSRVSWTAARTKAFIHRTQHGRWPDGTLPKLRYVLERAYMHHRWKVERLRKNRFMPRVLDDGAFDVAAERDGTLSDSDDEEYKQEDDDDVEDGGPAVDDVDVAPIGVAADGSNDSLLDDVLFVQARSRSPQRLSNAGKLESISPSTWYEIVPKSRVQAVLRSVFHSAGGTLFSTASTLYKQLAETYIGISHHDVSRFLASAEAAALSRSNTVADAIIAPSQPQRLGQRWASDLTFADGTLPFSPFVGLMTTVDRLSRFVWTHPVEDKSAAGIAANLEALFETEGPPELLQLDNSFENHSDTVRLVCQRHGVKLRFTRPYKSQENGLVEVAHKTIKQLLRKAVIDTQASGQAVDIASLLAAVTRMYNASPHSVTGLPPFLVWRGRPPPKLAPAIVVRKEENDDDDDGGAAAGAGSAFQKKKTSSAPKSVTTSLSRASKRELLHLLEHQQQQAQQQKELQRMKRSAAQRPPAPQSSAGSAGKRPRLEARMGPIDATLQRLGLTSQSQTSLRGKREGEMLASNSSSSSFAAPAVSLNDNWKIGKVLGIVYDAVAKRLLYGIRWSPPYDDPSHDMWLPAAWMNATDAQMSTWIKRKQPDELPVVFLKQFVGPGDLDRQKAIPFDTVLQEVEKEGTDGQDNNGEAFKGRDTSGQEIVEEAYEGGNDGQNDDDDNEEDDYAPQQNGSASLQYLEAARKQLHRAAAAQRRERVADTMSRVRDGLASSSASSAAGGRRDPRLRSNPFTSSIGSSAAAGNSIGGRRW